MASDAPALPALLLTPLEAARALSISPRTLWTFTRSGEVPCVRIGRSVRYSVAALDRWIAQRQAAVGGPLSGRAEG